MADFDRDRTWRQIDKLLDVLWVRHGEFTFDVLRNGVGTPISLIVTCDCGRAFSHGAFDDDDDDSTAEALAKTTWKNHLTVILSGSEAWDELSMSTVGRQANADLLREDLAERMTRP